MCGAQADVRFVPIADIGTLFDHLVGARLRCRRHVEAERLGRLQIDIELDFGGLLDRQVGGFLAPENPSGIHQKRTFARRSSMSYYKQIWFLATRSAQRGLG